VFLSRDPALADENLYRYCVNNPTNSTDPTGALADGISSNQELASAIDAMYKDPGFGTMKDGCKTIPFKKFLDYLDKRLTKDQKDIIGLCCTGIAQATCCNMNPSKTPKLPEESPVDPNEPQVFCYVGKDAERDARRRRCPAGYDLFVFAKQGEWTTPDKKQPPILPLPWPNNRLPNNKVIAGINGTDDFNYLSVVGDYYVGATAAARKPDAVVTICKNPNLPGPGRFPATMWCSGCYKKR
jgi:hypothetical protein